MLTETWLSPSIKDPEVLPFISDFTLHRYDRLSSRGGGVLIAIKSTIRHFRINSDSPFEALFVACESSHGLIILGVCYRPPKSDQSFNIIFNDTMDSLHKTYPRAKFIICGDFNYPTIDWSNLNSPNSSECSKFLDCLHNYQLTQVITQATRETSHSSNILDLILMSDPSSLQSLHYMKEIPAAVAQ